MDGLISILGIIISIIIFVLIIRLLGAWMLRINEIIRYQKKIINILESHDKGDKIEYTQKLSGIKK